MIPVGRETLRQMLPIHFEWLETLSRRDDPMSSVGAVQGIHSRHQAVVLLPVRGVEHIALGSPLRADVREDHAGPLVGVALAEDLTQHPHGGRGELQGAVRRYGELEKAALVVLGQIFLMLVGQDEDHHLTAKAVLGL